MRFPLNAIVLATLLSSKCVTLVAAGSIRAAVEETEQSHSRNLIFNELLGGEIPGLEGISGPLPSNFEEDNFVIQTDKLDTCYKKTYSLPPSGSFTTINPNAEIENEAQNGNELGGEMFQYRPFSGVNGEYRKLSDRGFDKLINKYMWSQAINPTSGLVCVGTFNVNYDRNREESYYAGVNAAVLSGDIVSSLDSYGRLWNGSPVTTSTGGEVWCSNLRDTFPSWNLRMKMPRQQVGCRGMTFYKNNFYCGGSNGPDGPEVNEPYDTFSLYRVEGGPRLFQGSANGEDWQRLDSGAHLNGYDRSLRAMCESELTGKLFIGTETLTSLVTVGRVISYDSVEKEFATYRLVNFGLAAVTECIDLGGGFMLFGATGIPSFKLFTMDELNGNVVTEVGVPLFNVFTRNHQAKGGSIPTPINVILELRIFKDRLYIGILDGLGFQFYRTSIGGYGRGQVLNWEVEEPAGQPGGPVSIDGFQQLQKNLRSDNQAVASNPYTWCSATLVVNTVETYFMGTLGSRNPSCDGTCFSDGRGQLWQSTDGINWNLLVADGFGELWTIGIRSMVADQNMFGPDQGGLSIGTGSVFVIPATNAPPYTDTECDPPNIVEEPSVVDSSSSSTLGGALTNDLTSNESLINLSYVKQQLGIPDP